MNRSSMKGGALRQSNRASQSLAARAREKNMMLEGTGASVVMGSRDGGMSAVSQSGHFGRMSGGLSMAGAPSPAVTAEPIEKEYIHNLQQQIYFLELELRYMREKGGGSFSGDPAEANIDESMQKLRSHYQGLKKNQLKANEDMRKRIEELEGKLMAQQYNYQHLQEEKKSVHEKMEKSQADMAEEKGKFLEEIVNLHKQIETLEREKQQMANDIASLDEERRRWIDLGKDSDLKIKHLDLQLDQEKKNKTHALAKEEAAMREMRSMKQQLDTILDEQKEKKRTESTLAEELSRTRAEAREAVADLNVVKTDKENLSSKLNYIDGKYQEVLKANQELQADLDKMHLENTSITREKNALSGARDRQIIERVAYRCLLRKMKSKYADAMSHLKEKDARIRELIETCAKLEHDRGVYKDEALRNRSKWESEMNHYQEINREHTELVKDNKLLADNIASLERDLELQQQKMDKVIGENSDLRVLLTQMKSKLDIAKDLDKLNVDDFKTLMNTNLEVASSIHKLMGKMRHKGERKDVHGRPSSSSSDSD
eukprot:GFYU01003257.1.p1 GENE.GFYU01003257.1~~GFYU01003257.1.p1  ORF type:complete len:544 (+),score=204.66 GFYU01003257.1:164-1795(+)